MRTGAATGSEGETSLGQSWTIGRIRKRDTGILETTDRKNALRGRDCAQLAEVQSMTPGRRVA